MTLVDRLIIHADGTTEGGMVLEASEPSVVVHPSHYSRFVIEPVTFCAANNLSFNISNIVKYVCRAEHKNGLEDLLKARRYVEMEIESVKRWARVAAGENAQDVWKESL